MEAKSLKEIIRDYDGFYIYTKLKYFEEASQHVFKSGRNITCTKVFQYHDDDCGTSRGKGPNWWEQKRSMTEKEKKAADCFNNFILRFLEEAELLEKELFKIKNES